MEEKTYTRGQAAQELLDIARNLSNRVYLLRPINIDPVKTSIAIVGIEIGLAKLGYAYFSPPLASLGQAQFILQSAHYHNAFTIFDALSTAQHLLEAVRTLSDSSTPFPLPIRHLPPEILRLIYHHIAYKPLPYDDLPFTDCDLRQQTINALSLTSTTWRQIVLEHPVVYLTTIPDIREYTRLSWSLLEPDSHHWRRPWKEFHVDLTRADITNFIDDWEHYKDIIEGMIVPRPRGSEMQKGKLVVTLDTERNFLSDLMQPIREITSRSSHFALQIPHMERQDYDALDFLLFGTDWMQDKDAAEYYIGKNPVHLTTRTAQAPIDEDIARWAFDQDEDELKEGESLDCVNYQQFQVLSIPWLVVNAPIFLLETVPKAYRPGTNIPPCRLRHLEISFEVDPSNPAQAIQELESFFSVISPKIERLAFRLRLTSPHPSPADEIDFTEHLTSCLLSCRRLRHLEIGGFGLSPCFISQLGVLTLSTLAILPLQHAPNYGDLISLVNSHPPLRNSLKVLRCQTQSIPSNPTHPELLEELSRRCRDEGIDLKIDQSSEEEAMLAKLMGLAGVPPV